ncbi:MAG: hypothetical protein IT349_14210 [Candidatus Eisenbacteria bacterium]|nr:hypothetical protein [Candidatus Eisenbacteria bacterium]
MLILGLASLPGAAQAQPGLEPAFVDSSSTFFGRLGMHPHYTSSLSLLETSSTWNQGFQVARALGPVSTRTQLDLAITKNSAQQNYRRNGGKGLVELAYNAAALGGLASGTRIDWRRSLEKSDFSRTVENGSNIDLFVDAKTPEHLIRDLFAMSDSSASFSWDLGGSFGLTETKSIRQNRERARRYLTKYDSTSTDGWQRQFDSLFRAGPGDSWEVTASGSATDASEDSYTRSQEWLYDPRNLDTPPAFSDSVLSEPNANRARSARGGLRLKPGRLLSLKVDGDYRSTRQQLYDTSKRERDTRTVLDHKVSGSLGSKLNDALEITLEGRSNFVNNGAQRNENLRTGKRENGGKATVDLLVPDWAGPLRAIEMTTEVERTDTEFTYFTTPDYQRRLFRLNQIIRRKLNQAVTLSVQGEGRLTSDHYLDGAQDRDELRWSGNGTLNYKPQGSKFSGRITFDRTETNTINIAAERSIGNATDTNYSISANYDYKLSPNVTFNQKYLLSAAYSVFDFREDSNRLVRSTQVTTGLNSRLGERATLKLEHRYTFKDLGSYVRLVQTDPRTYAKSNEENNQHLFVETRYEAMQGFEFHGSQKFEVRESTTLASGKVTRTERLDLLSGVSLDHQFSTLFSVRASVDRANKVPGKDHWRISASLDRKF